MELSLLIEYGWVLLVLIGLEGLLSADNALVMAIMVKHLPEKKRQKALFYGLGGAFVFRFSSLFIISFLIGVWQVQAVGAAYLIFLSINHIIKKYFGSEHETEKHAENGQAGSGFWMTVLKVELADIAFAVDSIMAAVALVVTLPNTPLPNIGGLDGAKFMVVFCGGFIGLIIIRFAATLFVKLLQQRPGLETAAYLIVGWVGVKLAVFTLSHPKLAILPENIPETMEFKLIFWSVLILIALSGWFFSKDKKEEHALN
ncbi:MAG: TerC family protein [Bacillota bacterium]|jgi:YkoY family integral membrane protein